MTVATDGSRKYFKHPREVFAGWWMALASGLLCLWGYGYHYGIGMGSAMPMTPVMQARYFGRKHFGMIVGLSRAMHMPVGFLGPIAAGWIYDVTGSYHSAFVYLAVLLGVSGIIVAFAAPPKVSASQAKKEERFILAAIHGSNHGRRDQTG